ncbi:hypothetical protein FOVSG1_013227 [Fusarium oxysporum f. sp. vasinfectum]
MRVMINVQPADCREEEPLPDSESQLDLIFASSSLSIELPEYSSNMSQSPARKRATYLQLKPSSTEHTRNISLGSANRQPQ